MIRFLHVCYSNTAKTAHRSVNTATEIELKRSRRIEQFPFEFESYCSSLYLHQA